MDLGSIAHALTNLPTDWIIIGAFAAFAALDAVRSGSARACALALSLPISLVIFSVLPHDVVIGGIAQQFGTPTLQAILFLLVLVAAYLLIRKIGFSYGTDSGAPVQALLAGVSLAAIATIVWLQVPSLQSLWHFGGQVQTVFGEAYRFWWFAFAYLALAFVRR